ncbi:unnamed protein product [Phaeothamnion confervicola]
MLALPRGWAWRPPHGETHGVKYMSDTRRAAPSAMFERGEKGQGVHDGPAQMLAQLIQDHPRRYNLPGLSEVAAEVSGISQKAKRRPEVALRRVDGGRGPV